MLDKELGDLLKKVVEGIATEKDLEEIQHISAERVRRMKRIKK